jgi:hypothetical protein
MVSSYLLVKVLIPFALIGMLIAVVLPPGMQPALVAQPTSSTYRPVADAYVSKASPGTNYGDSTTLRVDNSPLNSQLCAF